MITSIDCWMKETCKKFAENNCGESEFCIKLFKLDYLYEQALISKNNRVHKKLCVDADLTDKEEFKQLFEIQTHIEEFVQEGNNLFIYSKNCGNGKTSWAIRLIQSYFNCIWYKCDLKCKALFINVPKFLIAIKENLNERSEYISHIMQNIHEADIVVWDDIATKAATTFEHETLLSLINSRLDKGKTNIYTSNLIPEQIYESLGDRLYSRIINMSHVIQLNGMDKRGISL